MWPGTANSGGWRSPQAFAGTRTSMREPARSDKKKPQPKNGWGFVIGGGNADLPQISLKARVPRNSLIINVEVISHNNFPTTRPEKRFSPLISRHRTRVTGLQ